MYYTYNDIRLYHSAKGTTWKKHKYSAKERMEQRLAEKDLELKQAKTEALQSAKRIEELYSKAMGAFQSYWPDAVDEYDD